MPRHFHNQISPEVTLLPKERARVEFSRNLYDAMVAKGWSQSELARNASKFLPEGEELGRDSISVYIRGKALPRGAALKALADSLGVEASDLLPPQAAPSSLALHAPPIDVQDAGNDEAWLRINQRVPWTVAVEIMKLLKGSKNGRPADTGATGETG